MTSGSDAKAARSWRGAVVGTVVADRERVVLPEARPVGDQAIEARGERGRADHEGDDRRERGDRAVRRDGGGRRG